MVYNINDNLTEQMVSLNKQLFPMSQDNTENTIVEHFCKKIYSGGTPSTSEDSFWDGELPWLSSGETSNNYITKTQKHITSLGVANSSTKLAKDRSIVIASAGQGLTRGQTSLLLKEVYVNQSVIVLEPLEQYNYFLFSNLKGRYEEMRNISDLDSIRGSLTTKTVASLPIAVPNKNKLLEFERLCYAIVQQIHVNLGEIEHLNSTLSSIISSISRR